MASDTPSAKKARIEKFIGTHNGTFHCDEALAVFLLRHTAAYRNSEVKRSRDPAVLDTCDIVVDVGAVYDESKQRFDHHQRGFEEVFGWGFNTKLSSAGLVYKHFGKEIISSQTQVSVDHRSIQTLWLKLYKELIESIDANDNGISQYSSDLNPRYRVRTDLSSRVAHLNPPWNKTLDAQGMDAQFEKASMLTGSEFLDRLEYYANAWLPARDLLVAAIQNSKEIVDPSGRIILLESFLPWKEHLFDLESENTSSLSPVATYIVYPDEFSGNWRVQAVPVSAQSFESRKALPEKWRGLRDDIFSETSGVPGGIFVHASGFIGGNKTKEGAMQMAKVALDM
ncbi:GAMM1 protein [Lentinula aciculospora]|uniref:GAMM1 protein n=1 Tax=Lentinula aciculospora TaxID=153920 RepID=A0A9W9AM32_9AGAR|nr:GAMM1 protein [Lentinula aciculospora]